jgi:hypothetical protein
MPITAMPRRAIRTRLCRWEPRTGSANRRHTSPCQSLPHLAELFGLARDDGRCALEIVAPLLQSTPSSSATSVAEQMVLSQELVRPWCKSTSTVRP